MATRRFFEGMVPLIDNASLGHGVENSGAGQFFWPVQGSSRERRLSYCLLVSWWFNYDVAVAEIQSRFCTFFQNFYPWKGRLGATIQNGSTNKCEMNLFWIPYEKRGAQIFCFWLFSFYAREPARGPKKDLAFDIGWTRVVGSTWNFSEANHDSHKPWTINATFLIRCPNF